MKERMFAIQAKFFLTHPLSHSGALNEHSIAAHCTHLTPEEYTALSKAGQNISFYFLLSLLVFFISLPSSLFTHLLTFFAGVWLAHNPQSNMNNGVGTPDIPTLLSSPSPLSLTLGKEGFMKEFILVFILFHLFFCDFFIFLPTGTDGMCYSMLQELKVAYLVHKHNHHDPSTFSGSYFHPFSLSFL